MTTIDYATCSNCGLCAKVCAAKIIRESDGRYRLEPYPDWECVRCGLCMSVCPTRSIRVEGFNYKDFTPLGKQVIGIDPLISSLMHRRSVRDYRPDRVSREALLSVVAAAATAPMGMPPTDVEVLVMDRRRDIDAILPELRKQYQGLLFIMGNPITRAFMRLVQGSVMYHALATHVVPAARTVIERSEKGRDYFTYGAPALMIFHGDRYKVAIEQDCFIAASYASVAALTLGLGSCFTGLIPPIVERSKKIRKELGIPRQNGVFAGLMLGYPAVKFKRSIPREMKTTRFFSKG